MGDEKAYPPQIARYLDRLYDRSQRKWACAATTPREVSQWQQSARPVLRSLVGLDLIRDQAGNHTPSVSRGAIEDCGDFTRQKCAIQTEPDVEVPFWLLQPKDEGTKPLAVTPHGHNKTGYDTYAGVAHDEQHAEHIQAEDRDVAVQAVRHGFTAIAPATRGLAEGYVTDLSGMFGQSDCASHFMHALLAGRTSIGERVWDMQRIIDWATGLSDVDTRDVLMMGNSGGGVLTTWAAALDTRIGIAVASCAYNSFVGRDGTIHHHYCNAVPGVLTFGEAWDVAGLIAPRHFMAVHGSEDAERCGEQVDHAVRELRGIYKAAGTPENFDQKYGDGGHRFYKDLMWPFILGALEERHRARQ